MLLVAGFIPVCVDGQLAVTGAPENPLAGKHRFCSGAVLANVEISRREA